MSFGGHVNDMVNRVKQNAALKNSRRGKFKGGNDYSHISTKKTTYNLPKLPKAELEKLKLQLKATAKKERIKQLKILFFAIILPAIIAFIIFNFY